LQVDEDTLPPATNIEVIDFGTPPHPIEATKSATANQICHHDDYHHHIPTTTGLHEEEEPALHHESEAMAEAVPSLEQGLSNTKNQDPLNTITITITL
jgi:hypothetical protein